MNKAIKNYIEVIVITILFSVNLFACNNNENTNVKNYNKGTVSEEKYYVIYNPITFVKNIVDGEGNIIIKTDGGYQWEEVDVGIAKDEKNGNIYLWKQLSDKVYNIYDKKGNLLIENIDISDKYSFKILNDTIYYIVHQQNENNDTDENDENGVRIDSSKIEDILYEYSVKNKTSKKVDKKENKDKKITATASSVTNSRSNKYSNKKEEFESTLTTELENECFKIEKTNKEKYIFTSKKYDFVLNDIKSYIKRCQIK